MLQVTLGLFGGHAVGLHPQKARQRQPSQQHGQGDQQRGGFDVGHSHGLDE